MAHLFSSGLFVDFILLLVLLEAALLSGYFAIAKRGIAPADLLPNLFSGAFLLLALRSVLLAENWKLSCAYLAAAGVSHVIDISRRWRK